MRWLAAFIGFLLVGGVSAQAGCKIVETGVLGEDSVLTGTIRGFEDGGPYKPGEEVGIYLTNPCDFVIAWKIPYPKSCKVGSKVTARGFYDPDIKTIFLADSVKCR
jgi:hypothetical protein